MYCRNCKKTKFKKILNMGSQPISRVFYKFKKKNLKKYPLDLYRCLNCNLIQFSKLAPLDDLYGSTYGYRTSLSKLMISHMKKKFYNLNNIKYIKKNSCILDIGCNDGTFLNFFAKKRKDLNLFGIDPSSQKFRKYYNKKINLIPDYFSKRKIDKFFIEKKIKKKFDLITSFAMFYDFEDPNAFAKDIFNLLNKNGLWVLEFSYFPLLLKNLTYDQICHEHVTYYTLSTFNKIVKQNGFKIIDFSLNEINGGSIEVTCSKKNSKHKPKEKKIETIISEEKKILVTVPPLIWNGFTNIGKQKAILANCSAAPYSDEEIIRKSPFDKFIPYKWSFR